MPAEPPGTPWMVGGLGGWPACEEGVLTLATATAELRQARGKAPATRGGERGWAEKGGGWASGQLGLSPLPLPGGEGRGGTGRTGREDLPH